MCLRVAVRITGADTGGRSWLAIRSACPEYPGAC
jgi:hypothetical protein